MSIKGFAEPEPDAGTAVPFTPDPSQAAVIALADGVSASVLGAPGTGKTATLVEFVVDRARREGWSANNLVVLTPNRASATRLRDILALRLGVPTTGPIARTVNSLAFEIVGAAAAAAGAPTPRLVTGGDQDADISQLLNGHVESGLGPRWPELLGPDVRRLRSFRSELRELMARCTEHSVTPGELRLLGEREQHPEWVAAADFIDEYLTVISSSRPSQVDPAELIQFAIAALGPDGSPGERVAALRLVVVDDFQDVTESTLGLLRALVAREVAVVAFGDPDVAVNAFRGGETNALGRLQSQLGLARVETHVLSTVYRHGPALRELTTRVTERIGTAEAGPQRKARSSGDPVAAVPPIVTVEAPTPGRLWASVARVLREHHLTRDVPWTRMAVVVRSGAQLASAARSLALADVPTRTAVGGRPLRDDHAARALLLLVDVGSGRTQLSAELAVEILLGPFGGLDRLGLRRLRLALRAEELAAGGARQSDELLVEALEAPGRLVTIDHRVGRRAEKIAELLSTLRVEAAAGATIEELLWLAWDSSGLAAPWFEQALGSGIVANEANRHLDGVVALFTAAKRYVEREPGSPAGNFLANVLDAEVPEDTLSPQPTTESVFVSTVPGVVGLEYDVVVVAGVQEGAWPNLRLRGSLLDPQELVRVVTGVDSTSINERTVVLGDELRMFALAVSRAREQVVVAAVANENEASSVFFRLLPDTAEPVATLAQTPLTLRGMTGRLRRVLVESGTRDSDRRAAASALSRLAAEHLPGADPSSWHGLLEPSTMEPLFGDDEPVPVSPSQLEKFEEDPVDWFIESIAGSQPTTSMALGTVVHWAMEHATEPTIDAVWANIEERWSELSFEAPWVATFEKRIARNLAAAVAEYLGDFAREGKHLVGAESRFTLEVGRAKVNGSIDRVERSSDGSVVIVDLKTGRAITSQATIDEHPQLMAYQLAYAEGVLDTFLEELGEHRAGGAKLLFVKEGIKKKLYREGVQAALSAEALEGFRERIRQAAIAMAVAQFEGKLEFTEFGGGGGGMSSRAMHRVPAVPHD